MAIEGPDTFYGRDDKPGTCCEMRRKVTVFLGPVLSAEECGVADSVLADFLRFDLPAAEGPSGEKKPVIGFRFCPWCGAAFTATSETRTTAMFEMPEPPEAWQGGDGAEDDGDE